MDPGAGRSLSDFLGSFERQYGIANQPFAEYAVDRLAVSVQNASRLCSVMDEAETLELARITDGLHYFFTSHTCTPYNACW